MATSYHFSVGNSSEGPIGLCAVVRADTPGLALECLRERLDLAGGVIQMVADEGSIEYINIYLNGEAITEDDLGAPPAG